MVGAVVNKWCKKSKGTIMGLALASNGIGAAIAIQILSPIIHSGDDIGDPFTYRNAYRLCALILAVMLVLILVFFKNSPDGKNAKSAIREKREKPDYKSILKTPYFYPAAVFIFCAGMVLQSVSGIAAPIMDGAGMADETVANVLSVSALFLFVTKFGVGFLYDKTGVRHTSTICYLSAIVAIGFLFSVSRGAPAYIAYIYTVFAALALPLETIMLPIYARELFGEKRFNVALGIFASVNTAGYALGAPLANLCYDLFGNYEVSLYVGAAVMAIAFVIVHITISVAKKKLAEA
jgi:predicted MFS family arabinose efflux permease